MRRVILASKSPRRQELLKMIIDDFDIKTSNNPEKISKFLPLKKVPVSLAKQKALEVYKNNKDCVVIGADTVVIANNEILGKPKDKEDVRRMITMLSGNSHIVVTGVYIVCKEYKKSFSCVTTVNFRKMSEQEINDYCELDTIYDKAGAYAIQSSFAAFVDRIEGNYMGVIGLPINRVYEILKENEII
jgi:septum formation protein